MTKSQAARRDELAEAYCEGKPVALMRVTFNSGYDAAIKDAEVLVDALNYAKGQIIGLTEGLANEMCERPAPRTAYIDKALDKWRGKND